MPGIKRKASSLCDETLTMAPANKRIKLDVPSITVERKLSAAIKRKASSISDDTSTPLPPALDSQALVSRPMSFPAKRVKLDSNSDNVENKFQLRIVTPMSDEDFMKRYHQTAQIAEGGFGKVIRALDKKTQTPVIAKSFLRENVYEWTGDMPTEINILMSLNHKNIAPMLDAFKSDLNYRITMPDTIMERTCMSTTCRRILTI